MVNQYVRNTTNVLARIAAYGLISITIGVIFWARFSGQAGLQRTETMGWPLKRAAKLFELRVQHLLWISRICCLSLAFQYSVETNDFALRNLPLGCINRGCMGSLKSSLSSPFWFLRQRFLRAFYYNNVLHVEYISGAGIIFDIRFKTDCILSRWIDNGLFLHNEYSDSGSAILRQVLWLSHCVTIRRISGFFLYGIYTRYRLPCNR